MEKELNELRFHFEVDLGDPSRCAAGPGLFGGAVLRTGAPRRTSDPYRKQAGKNAAIAQFWPNSRPPDFGAKQAIQQGRGELFLNATDLLNTMVIRKEVTSSDFNFTSTDYKESQVFRLGYSYKF